MLRLVRTDYGFPEPTQDSLTPDRLGRYLHPDAPVQEADRKEVYTTFHGPNGYTYYADGNELKALNQAQQMLGHAADTSDPMTKAAATVAHANFMLQAAQQATDLDATAIEQNPTAFPIDPKPGAVPSPGVDSAMAPGPQFYPGDFSQPQPQQQLQALPQPVSQDAFAQLAPPPGYDTNAAAVFMDPTTGLPMAAPQPMTYNTQPPTSLDTAALQQAATTSPPMPPTAAGPYYGAGGPLLPPAYANAMMISPSPSASTAGQGTGFVA